MKLKNLFALVAVCIMTLLQSCTNEQEPMVSDALESESSVSHMVVKFEDHIYETDVKVVGDSVTYLNQEYADVYKYRISILPDLATIMTVNDGVTYVEYLATPKDVEKKYNFIKTDNESVASNQNTTRGNRIIDLWNPNTGAIKLGYAELYDDKNYEDTVLLSYVTTTWFNAVASLSDLGFNDKCSSIKVYNTMNPGRIYTFSYIEESDGKTHTRSSFGSQLRPVLVSHHNSKFKGSTLYCIAPPSGSADPHMDSNLRSIGWNDKISSIEWILVYDFTKFMEMNPDLPHESC